MFNYSAVYPLTPVLRFSGKSVFDLSLDAARNIFIRRNTMTTEEMLLQEIVQRGYDARLNEVIKNGVVRKAMAIKGKGNCSPNIYLEKFLKDAEKGADIKTLADEILDIAAKHDGIDFDIDNVLCREYIMSHVYIAVQKESSEKLIKRGCGLEGLESFLYLKVKLHGTEGSIKLSDIILKHAGLTEEEVWAQAEENLKKETVIEPVYDMVCHLMKESGRYPGFSEEERREMMEGGDNLMYVITNKEKYFGASAILDRENIRGLAEKCGVKDFIVIPSSKHEMILVPGRAEFDISAISDMVKEVNETMVSPEDRLTDRAYRLTA